MSFRWDIWAIPVLVATACGGAAIAEGDEPDSGSAGSANGLNGGGAANPLPVTEWIDDAGRCRVTEEPAWHKCPATLQEALARTFIPPMSWARDPGKCGAMIVWYWGSETFEAGCGYDSTGATLVAWSWSDDAPSHCGYQKWVVYSPNWPVDCMPVPLGDGG